jgi:CDP-diacylglycerol---serine O-phosphatidyltransferase
MIKIQQLRYLIPNGFTASSMALGITSAYLSAHDQFTLAAWMITWGVLLDKLDGSAARLFNASSDFGVQFDSFADFVIFGIAPASLFYHWLGGIDGTYGVLTATIACSYIILTATRLALFNISTPPGGDQYFFGLPTTLSGATLSTFYLSTEIYAPEIFSKSKMSHQTELLLLAMMMVAALMMVSRFILPKLKTRKSKFINIFQFVNVGLVYLLSPFQLYPEYLFVLCLIYLTVGFIAGAIHGISVDDTPIEAS